MVTTISPWAGSVYLTSPDGKLTAAIDDASEIGQGAPTSGILHISNGMSYRGCNPSIVWSDDSQYLAVPQWTRERDQRLLVISLRDKSSGYAPDVFRVLELHLFLSSKIKGIDSPIYQSREIEIDLNQIQWA